MDHMWRLWFKDTPEVRLATAKLHLGTIRRRMAADPRLDLSEAEAKLLWEIAVAEREAAEERERKAAAETARQAPIAAVPKTAERTKGFVSKILAGGIFSSQRA